jgi:hypothetical protein
MGEPRWGGRATCTVFTAILRVDDVSVMRTRIRCRPPERKDRMGEGYGGSVGEEWRESGWE